MGRSDLICESGIMNDSVYRSCVHEGKRFGTAYSDITVNEDAERQLGVKRGRYMTVFTGNGDVKGCLCELLRDIIPSGSVLAAGFGNMNISSDSIGVKALRHIPATAHLSGHKDFRDLGMRSVYVLEAGVTGKTGIESSILVTETAKSVGAGCIIAFDSLACTEIEKLCATIQITDAGISPGRGVGNDRQPLNRETAGIPVIAVGVPTVIDLDSVCDMKGTKGLMVTPRNIDLVSDRLSGIVGKAVSAALNPSLTENELEALLLK